MPEPKRVVCVPVDAQGRVDPRWGRARTVAVAEVIASGLGDWVTYPVEWDRRHDLQTEGRHHAEIARFLQDHAVTDVVVDHVGEGMARMLARMGIRVHTNASGDAKTAVLRALAVL